MALTRRRRIVFVAAATALSVLLSVAVFFALDLYLHRKYEMSFGLNRWGYRGEVLGRKAPGEKRVAVVGGSTAFGYGVSWKDAWPALLEAKLNAGQTGGSVTRVANLAYNGEGAHSFQHTLKDYLYLDYDLALLYTGVNDLGGENYAVSRHASGIYRLTGYLPLAPMVFHEKAISLRAGGDLDAAYGGRTVFEASPQARFAATMLEGAVGVVQNVETQLGGTSAKTSGHDAVEGRPCGERWGFYCQQVFEAVRVMLQANRPVLVVSEPFVGDAQIEQQRLMVEMLERNFPGEPRLRYLNLGHVVDPRDEKVSWDGMHLRAAANAIVADHLVQPVRDFLALGSSH